MAQADLQRQLEFLMQQQKHLLHLVGLQNPAALHGGTRTPAETLQSVPSPPTTTSLQPLEFFPGSTRMTLEDMTPAAVPKARIDAETVPDLNAAVSSDDNSGIEACTFTPTPAREGASGATMDADKHGIHVSGDRQNTGRWL